MIFKKIVFYILPFFSFSLFANTYTLHGHEINDPCAYLEDMESTQTLDWLEKQENHTSAYYSALTNRESIRKKLIKYTPIEALYTPVCQGGNLFTFHRPKGADKYRFEMQKPEQQPHVLVDPNTFDQNENISLTGSLLSEDGTQFYYALSQSGSDFTTWKLYSLVGQQNASEMTHSKFAPPIWSFDSQGIFYSRWKKGNFADPDINLGIYFHPNDARDDQEDRLIVANNNSNLILFPLCMLDKDRLVYSEMQGSASKLGVKVVNLKTHEIEQIIPNDLAKFTFVQKSKNTLYFLTDDRAPNHKLIALSMDQLRLENAFDVLAECEFCLEDVVITQDYILGNYTIDCQSQIKIYDRQGVFQSDLKLPIVTNIVLGKMSPSYDSYALNEVFFSTHTFLNSPSIHHFQIKDQTITTTFQSKETNKNWVTEQVFFTSKDGTQIPMFISHSKDLKLDGKNPTLMWGYGGFGISMPPYFSPHHAVWLDQGGIFVSVNLRGGLEYGKDWHDAGKGHHKQNVFDDFISAGEYLIEKGYTSPEKLAIHGTSNGGLLVGACITQRPELFKAAVAQVPVMDMLKFHKYTIGKAWISDYGDPEDPKDFEILYRYSPYHNAEKAKNHPALLVLTAEHDNRVVPLHSYKFVARLQEVSESKAPILLRVNRKQGHSSGGGSIYKMIDLQADILTFLSHELGMEQN